MRPAESVPTLSRDRATDFATIVKVLRIYTKRVFHHADGLTHAATRRFLETVGLPRNAGEFELNVHVGPDAWGALREYSTTDVSTRVYRAEHVPAGLAGLFLLGTLGDGAEAAVDGQTGELYRVAADFSLSWLASDLEAFFLPLFVPDDRWLWRLTMDTIDLLDGPDVARIGAGELALVTEALDGDGHERLRTFLREHGDLLNCLRVTASYAASADLTGVDFATSCPNLTELHLHRGTVNESVFAHPALATLVLKESEYKGGTRDLDLDSGSRLITVALDDCLIHADTLRVGPGSPLRSLHAAIDEDFGFEFPALLEFDNCSELSKIDLNFDGGVWKLVLRGSLPRLCDVWQDARPYGSFTWTVQAATPADNKAYQSIIRKGARRA